MWSSFKELCSKKINPIHLFPGDSIELTYKDATGTTILAETTLHADHSMTVDDVIFFEGVYDDRRSLGGMVLEKNA